MMSRRTIERTETRRIVRTSDSRVADRLRKLLGVGALLHEVRLRPDESPDDRTDDAALEDVREDEQRPDGEEEGQARPGTSSAAPWDRQPSWARRQATAVAGAGTCRAPSALRSRCKTERSSDSSVAGSRERRYEAEPPRRMKMDGRRVFDPAQREQDEDFVRRYENRPPL